MDFSRLLTPNLSVNQVWVDFFDSMQEALNEHVFNPALDLAKLQNSFNYDEVAILTKQENGDLLSASDLDQFERALLLLLSDDLGFYWENNTYLSNEDYTRIIRYLARYWAVSQTPEFIRFMSFVFNGLFEHKMLWTKDYITFNSGDEVLVDPFVYKDYWAGKERMYLTPRANLLTSPSNFNSGAWAKNLVTVLPDVVVGPNNSYVDSCIVDVGVGNHTLTESVALIADTDYTFSVYVKSNGVTAVGLEAYSASENAIGSYTFISEQIVSSGGSLSSFTSTHLPAAYGWHRVILSFTPTVSQNFELRIILGTAPYVGDGISSLYLLGAQIEESEVATSLIETTSPVTDYSFSGDNLVFAFPPEIGAKIILSDNGNLEGDQVLLPDIIIGYGNAVSTSFPYSLFRRLGTGIAEGGDWYPTSHIRLETDMEKYGSLPLDILSSFFYYFAPINLVLKEIILRVQCSANAYFSMSGRMFVCVKSSELIPDTLFLTMSGNTFIHIQSQG